MIRKAAEAIFIRNTDYSQPHQAVNQLESLNVLSRDLYTDAYRFIYELLQNADDAAAGGQKVRIGIRLLGDQLIVAHTGKPFDERDLNGICGVSHGTKKNAPDKTGFKGIGFKAVFGQSEKVIVYSGGEYFRFDASYQHEWKSEWGGSKATWEKENDRAFAFPWHIIPIYTPAADVPAAVHRFLSTGDWTVATIVQLRTVAETSAAVARLSERVNMFLFLKNIEDIDFSIGTGHRVTIDRRPDNVVVMKSDGVDVTQWLIRRVDLRVPATLKTLMQTDPLVPEKLKTADKIDLTLAASIGDAGLQPLSDDTSQIYAYLPTEETRYHFPVLVNAAFLTAANRESLHADSRWNAWLFENIAVEIFRWSAELVRSSWLYQAYKILPDQFLQDDLLADNYNRGFERALNEVAFVIAEEGAMIKIREAVVDFTFLSNQLFIGKDKIRQYLVNEGRNELVRRPFVPVTGSGIKLKHLGAASFDWTKFKGMLTSEIFRRGHTPADNIQLIAHLKGSSEAAKPSEVTNRELKGWNFLMDQHGQLKTPVDIFFPAPDDLQEDVGDATLSFLHPTVRETLLVRPGLETWLKALGVVEKSDLTFFEKKILSDPGRYITQANAIETIQFIYRLFYKGEIVQDTLKELESIKLLTKHNSLVPAKECYFSDAYAPRLCFEEKLNVDFFVSEQYMPVGADVSEWRRFFKFLGVNEGIALIKYQNRTPKADIPTSTIETGYFDHIKTLKSYPVFAVEAVTDLKTLFLLPKTRGDVAFSKLFWADAVRTIPAAELSTLITMYWGYHGYSGYITGNTVTNYLPWFLGEFSCLPTTMDTCELAKDIFLNTEDNLTIGGKYLPVFDGETLNPDWKSLLRLKPEFALSDYLDLLSGIAGDPIADNKRRIQSAFQFLLDNFANLSEADRIAVATWAQTGSLLCEDGSYQHCNQLAYYADGENDIFQGAYQFVYLAKGQRKHASLDGLLTLLGISVLRQDQFVLDALDSEPALTLQQTIDGRLPYLAKWMERSRGVRFEQLYQELLDKRAEFSIQQAKELLIKYGTTWSRKVNVHFASGVLTVSVNWSSGKSMLSLPSKLAELLGAKGFHDEIAFLIKVEPNEIEEYFSDEGIELPPAEIISAETTAEQGHQEISESTVSAYLRTIEEKHRLDYSAFLAENLANNAALIAQANGNAATLLLNGLQTQNPDVPVNIYHFSHVENAVGIIREGAIKSRATAEFQDSAGSGIIKHTSDEKKEFARFYFRTKTPTQFYVENFGRGKQSIAALGDDPVCPVPVFFIIPLKEALNFPDWNVSIGSMASSEVRYGNSFDIVSTFNFTDVYKDIGAIAPEKFKVVAHQEFLIKDKLDLSKVNYRLAVQDEFAKQALLAILGDGENLAERITIEPGLYNNQNPRVAIDSSSNKIEATFSSTGYDGHLILQHDAIPEWQRLKAENVEQFQHDGIVTTIADDKVFFASLMENFGFSVYYCYKGRIWLVHTNNTHYQFNNDYVKFALSRWFADTAIDPETVIKIMRSQPSLGYWYAQAIGGSDGLNLEQHTKAVIENYQTYFNGKQHLFAEERHFYLLLALHDIGKPSAVASKNKNLQHERSLLIIDNVRSCLPIDDAIVNTMKTMIDGDIIGRYMNPRHDVSLEDTVTVLSELAEKLSKTIKELWPSLVIYYQCDAAGYQSLRRLFAVDDGGGFIFVADGSRLQFNEELEVKFQALEAAVVNL